MDTAATAPTNFPALSRNPRRSSPPCTYLSNRLRISCGKSDAFFLSIRTLLRFIYFARIPLRPCRLPECSCATLSNPPTTAFSMILALSCSQLGAAVIRGPAGYSGWLLRFRDARSRFRNPSRATNELLLTASAGSDTSSDAGSNREPGAAQSSRFIKLDERIGDANPPSTGWSGIEGARSVLRRLALQNAGRSSDALILAGDRTAPPFCKRDNEAMAAQAMAPVRSGAASLHNRCRVSGSNNSSASVLFGQSPALRTVGHCCGISAK